MARFPLLNLKQHSMPPRQVKAGRISRLDFQLGGKGAIEAVCLARLGVNTTFYTRLGSKVLADGSEEIDFAGKFMLDCLQAQPVEIQVQSPRITVHAANMDYPHTRWPHSPRITVHAANMDYPHTRWPHSTQQVQYTTAIGTADLLQCKMNIASGTCIMLNDSISAANVNVIRPTSLTFEDADRAVARVVEAADSGAPGAVPRYLLLQDEIGPEIIRRAVGTVSVPT